MKKGFIFVETMVVIAFLGTVLLTVYSSFTTVLDNAKKRLYYDDPVYLYRTYYLLSFLQENGLNDYIKVKFGDVVDSEVFISEFGCSSESVITGEYSGDSAASVGEKNFCSELYSKWDIKHVFIMPYIVDRIVGCTNTEDLTATEDLYCKRNTSLQNLSIQAVDYLYSLDGYTGSKERYNTSDSYRIVVEFEKEGTPTEYRWYEYNDVENLDVCKGDSVDEDLCNMCKENPELEECANSTIISTYKNYYTTIEIPFGRNKEFIDDEATANLDPLANTIDTYENKLKDAYLSPTYRDKILKIKIITDSASIPASPVESWDIGVLGDDVKAYLTISTDNSELYDLTIYAEGTIRANRESQYLFSSMSRLTEIIGLSDLDTSNTVNMDYMFAGDSSLQEIDLAGIESNKLESMRGMFAGMIFTGESTSLTNMNISHIYGLDTIDTSKVVYMDSLFLNCINLTHGDNAFDWDTSNVTDMHDMFRNNSSITTLDLSTFKTSKVTDMSGMFGGFDEFGNQVSMNLNTIILSTDFTTSNVTNMERMFQGLSQIEELNLSSFDTSKVTNMKDMFAGDKSLERLDLNNFKPTKLNYVNRMFKGCEKLKILNIKGLSFANIVDSVDDPPGYTFEGMPKNACVLVKGDEEVSWVGSNPGRPAEWNAGTNISREDYCGNTYIVRFNPKPTDSEVTGTMGDMMCILNDTCTIIPNKFKRTGYKFEKWTTNADGTGTEFVERAIIPEPGLTTINNEVVNLYVNWKRSTYQVEFNANSGSGTMEKHTCEYGENCTLPVKNFTKEGYTFTGWANDPDGSVVYNDNGTINQSLEDTSITLYAKWNANTYSIRYSSNGGTGTQMSNTSCTYDENCTLTANTYTKTGYTFSGWSKTTTGAKNYDDGATVSNLSSVNGDTVTIYAVWTPNTYSIKYNNNGGSGTMSDTSCTYDEACTLRANSFTKTGHTFAGWAKSATGAVEYANNASVTNLLTTGTQNLYAKWTPIQYKLNVSVYLDGSSVTNMNDTLTNTSIGTFTVKVNNKAVESNVTSFDQKVNYGSTYEIVPSGYSSNYRLESNSVKSGTITGDTTATLYFTRGMYNAINALGYGDTTRVGFYGIMANNMVLKVNTVYEFQTTCPAGYDYGTLGFGFKGPYWEQLVTTSYGYVNSNRSGALGFNWTTTNYTDSNGIWHLGFKDTNPGYQVFTVGCHPTEANNLGNTIQRRFSVRFVP